MLITKTLIPTDSRKSFYGKCAAIIDTDAKTIVLRSYSTIVAHYDIVEGKVVLNYDADSSVYSMTTKRHLRAFRQQAPGFTSCLV